MLGIATVVRQVRSYVVNQNSAYYTVNTICIQFSGTTSGKVVQLSLTLYVLCLDRRDVFLTSSCVLSGSTAHSPVHRLDSF
jgi:hypothetical protein